MTRLGMDPDAVEHGGRELARVAERLRALVTDVDRATQALVHAWSGRDADRHAQELWPSARAQLVRTAEGIDALSTCALRNAQEQRQASDVTGARAAPAWSSLVVPAGSAAAGGAWGYLGQALRQVSGQPVVEVAGYAAGVAALTADAGEYGRRSAAVGRFAGAVCGPLDALSIGASAYSAVEDLAGHHYRDAALSAGDTVADALKTKGPTAYVGGVAVQTWTEVARAAQGVDWSPQGLAQLRQVSMSDWIDAGADAVVTVAGLLPKILL